jgi:hypothetical protein
MILAHMIPKERSILMQDQGVKTYTYMQEKMQLPNNWTKHLDSRAHCPMIVQIIAL